MQLENESENLSTDNIVLRLFNRKMGINENLSNPVLFMYSVDNFSISLD